MQAISRRIALATGATLAFAAVSSAMKQACGQSADSVATPAKAARIVATAPPQVTSGVFLEVGVRAYTPPRGGAVEAVVTLSAGAGAVEQEVGRFSIFPDEPFLADDIRQQRIFRLDATAALAALRSTSGPLEVKVHLAPLDPAISSSDATLTVGRVVFEPPP
jgi:hypothetical protein